LGDLGDTITAQNLVMNCYSYWNQLIKHFKDFCAGGGAINIFFGEWKEISGLPKGGIGRKNSAQLFFKFTRLFCTF
jgi:hypothetical protein